MSKTRDKKWDKYKVSTGHDPVPFTRAHSPKKKDNDQRQQARKEAREYQWR